MTEGQWQIAIGVIGIIVAIIGWRFAASFRKRRVSQKQRVGKGGVGIQSGRDTHIGN